MFFCALLQKPTRCTQNTPKFSKLDTSLCPASCNRSKVDLTAAERR